MKAKLEFDLDDPDDKRAHLRCVKATDMAIMLWDIRHNMRKRLFNQSEIKFGKFDDSDEAKDHTQMAFESGIELVLDQLNEMFEENGLNMDDLLM